MQEEMVKWWLELLTITFWFVKLINRRRYKAYWTGSNWSDTVVSYTLLAAWLYVCSNSFCSRPITRIDGISCIFVFPISGMTLHMCEHDTIATRYNWRFISALFYQLIKETDDYESTGSISILSWSRRNCSMAGPDLGANLAAFHQSGTGQSFSVCFQHTNRLY